MKIRIATHDDLEIVKASWKDIFTQDSPNFIDYYFANRIDDSITLVLEVNSKIVTSLQLNPCKISLNNKIINCSYIVGVYTLEEYRGNGYMKQLMNYALNILEQEEIITLIQAYDFNLYKQFGFEINYFQDRYHIDSTTVNYLEKPQNINTVTTDDLPQLVSVYKQYTKDKTGYLIRDEQYYYNMLEEVKSEGGKLIKYCNSNGDVEGYIRYYNLENSYANEFIYTSKEALLNLITYLAKLSKKIIIETSIIDELEKIITVTKKERFPFLMTRINNQESYKDIMENNTLPLFINEYT